AGDQGRTRLSPPPKEVMMNVEKLMTETVRTCCPNDPLSAAARIMWEADCGCVPVTEECYGSAKVVGMITDRDICMAAYTQGRPLSEIQVGSVMARILRSCRTTDSIAAALKVLEQNQIRRLLVLDQDQRLMGLLSLADVAREAQREHAQPRKEVTDTQV